MRICLWRKSFRRAKYSGLQRERSNLLPPSAAPGVEPGAEGATGESATPGTGAEVSVDVLEQTAETVEDELENLLAASW